jgi:hypothetical protein
MDQPTVQHGGILMEAAMQANESWVRSAQAATEYLTMAFRRDQEEWDRVRQAASTVLRRTHTALERVELLAQVGWTLPLRMSLPDFHSLLLDQNPSLAHIDDLFVEYYHRDDGAYFSELGEHLLSSSELQFWKPLVEQGICAFERGHFAICIPSLLVIVEGFIATLWGVRFQTEKDRKKFFEQKVTLAPVDSVPPSNWKSIKWESYIWKSVAVFLESVFETAVSPMQEHPILKRHLIMHGKSDPSKWDEADCLRLFQAISTVLSLSE